MTRDALDARRYYLVEFDQRFCFFPGQSVLTREFVDSFSRFSSSFFFLRLLSIVHCPLCIDAHVVTRCPSPFFSNNAPSSCARICTRAPPVVIAQVAADAERATAEALARGRPPPPPPLSPTLVDKLANPEKTRQEARKAVEANAKVRRLDAAPRRHHGQQKQ